jgi:hypothetical protein
VRSAVTRVFTALSMAMNWQSFLVVMFFSSLLLFFGRDARRRRS